MERKKGQGGGGEGGRDETAREEEKPSTGKTMIGRRSLETCLPRPGKCTTQGVLDLHGARPRSAGKCVPRHVLFINERSHFGAAKVVLADDLH